MQKELKDKLKGTLIVPFGLILILLPFSMLIGWNLFTGILFWYVITPALSIYLPEIFIKYKIHLFESLIGLAIFYAIMVFMIYDHYKTDFFQIMIVSFVVNLIVASGLTWTKRNWC